MRFKHIPTGCKTKAKRDFFKKKISISDSPNSTVISKSADIASITFNLNGKEQPNNNK